MSHWMTMMLELLGLFNLQKSPLFVGLLMSARTLWRLLIVATPSKVLRALPQMCWVSMQKALFQKFFNALCES